jgi:transposase
MSRPIGTAAELERRRRRAVALLAQGESPTTVARILGVTRPSRYRWKHLADQPDGLAAKVHRGPTPGLTDKQLRELEGLLQQGAKAHGWPNQLWTAARVTQLIHRHCKVTFHRDHVRRFLRRRLGWTSQKPQRRAKERDEDAIARWLDDDFPRIVQAAWDRSAHLVFLDESGFMRTPSVRRSLAKRGPTPILDAWDRRDRISAISSISVSPKRHRLNLQFHLLADNTNAHGADVVGYLDLLRAARRGPMTIVWDRNQIHRKSKVVRAYLAAHPDIVVEDFPGDTPELNPDEFVWGWTKYGRLANRAAANTAVLRDHILSELIDLKFRPDLLSSFLGATNLPLLL